MIFTLSDGDVGVLTTDRLEQVAAVTSSTLIVSGIVVGQRELDTTFRYRNPTTWSASATLSDAALAAIVVDSDQGIYFEFTYTRTGIDTTGTIDILRHDLHYTIDPTATLGPGRFTTTTLYADCVEFVQGFIESCLVQVAGADGLSVIFSKPNACRPDARPMVYFHRLQLDERTTDSVGCNYRQRVQFRVGVKGQCNRDEANIRQQISYLLSIFNPFSFNEYTFDITFKGEERIGIRANALGVIEPLCGAMIELEDADCKCISNEFQVSFYLIFPIKNEI